METIGLIAAMTLESRALQRCLIGWRRAGPGPVHRLELSGRSLLLATSGMGVRRAGASARRLIEAHGARLLISFGIAGAVEADLEIGDAVAAEACCQLEAGRPGPLLQLAPWPELARQAMQQALAGAGRRLFTGTAITTGGPHLEYQPGQMAHPILEMETAGIARAAAQHGVPVLSLRTISDGPRAPIPVDLGQVMDADANLRVGKLLEMMIRHPGLLFRAGSMLRNNRSAADSAALALAAALSLPAGAWPA